MNYNANANGLLVIPEQGVKTLGKIENGKIQGLSTLSVNDCICVNFWMQCIVTNDTMNGWDDIGYCTLCQKVDPEAV